MAQWRPLHRRITQSDKAYELAEDPGALWLYCALLPHTDKEGRVNANPHHILGGILEGWPYTPDQIERWLLELARVGLIQLYSNGRRSHIAQFTKFQEMTKPDKREPASDLPGPTDEGSQSMLPEPPRPPARDSSRNLPEESPETPGESQEEPRQGDAETPRTHVHVHVHEHGDEQKPSSPELDRAPAPPAVVEAAPRREGREPPRYQAFVDAWNANRGPLPRVQSLNSSRRGQIDRLRSELGDEALDVFRDAVKQVAREPYWRQKGYGFGNLLTGGKVLNWAEKWRSSGGLSDSDRRIADKAAAVAEAIGGL